MDIRFFVSPLRVSKFYILGLATGHPGFAQLPKKQKEKLRRFLGGPKRLPDIPYSQYSRFIVTKKNLFKGDSNVFREILGRVRLRKFDNTKSKELVKSLRLKWKNSVDSVESYLDSVSVRPHHALKVFVISMIEEYAESLGDIVAIGSHISPNVAFGIFLEELLHATLRVPPQNRFFKKPLDKNLFAEAFVGAHLYKLFSLLSFNPKVRDSLVFGWQNGRRKKEVRHILARLD